MENAKEELIDTILEKSFKDGEKVRMLCAVALEIAEQFKVEPSEVGSICTDRNIRISECQLGCFR